MKNHIEESGLLRIGKRIKRLRKEKGISQDELCGDVIARSMLSLIETGKTAPSLHTLAFLADRLDVSVGYLFLSEEENASLLECRVLPEATAALERGDFRTCLALCEKVDFPSAYLRAIRTRAMYHLAFDRYRSGNVEEALIGFSRVLHTRGVEAELAGACEEMLFRIDALLSPEPLNRLYYGDPYVPSRGKDILAFARACIDNHTAKGVPEALALMDCPDENAKALALALLYAAQGRDADCRNAQNAVKDEKLEPAAAMYHYRMVQDCSVRMHDYETALKMTEKREALMNALRISYKRYQDREGKGDK